MDEKKTSSKDVQAEAPQENKGNFDMFLPLLTALFASNTNQSEHVALEKEVSYLHGKVDTLEKIILH